MHKIWIPVILLVSACGGVQRATLQDLAASPRELTPKQLNDAVL